MERSVNVEGVITETKGKFSQVLFIDGSKARIPWAGRPGETIVMIIKSKAIEELTKK